jgi:hypothetical protein
LFLLFVGPLAFALSSFIIMGCSGSKKKADSKEEKQQATNPTLLPKAGEEGKEQEPTADAPKTQDAPAKASDTEAPNVAEDAPADADKCLEPSDDAKEAAAEDAPSQPNPPEEEAVSAVEPSNSVPAVEDKCLEPADADKCLEPSDDAKKAAAEDAPSQPNPPKEEEVTQKQSEDPASAPAKPSSSSGLFSCCQASQAVTVTEELKM